MRVPLRSKHLTFWERLNSPIRLVLAMTLQGRRYRFPLLDQGNELSKGSKQTGRHLISERKDMIGTPVCPAPKPGFSPSDRLLETAIVQISSSRRCTDLPPATNERRYAPQFKMRGHRTKAPKGSSKVQNNISGEGTPDRA